MTIFRCKILMIFLCTSVYFSANAIVNIETLRAKKGLGTKHQSELKATGSSGNSENIRVEAVHAAAWQGMGKQTFLVMDYKYGESQSIKDTSQFFLHYRHATDTALSSLQVEYFSQWQSNQFQRLNSRFLVGSGIRHTLVSEQKLSAYLGLGAFWYQENISQQNQLQQQDEEGGRWNSYFSLQWELQPNISLFNTVYFQPQLQSLKDHNVLWDFQLKFLMSDMIALTMNWKVAHDNAPPLNIKSTDTTYMTGLVFNY